MLTNYINNYARQVKYSFKLFETTLFTWDYVWALFLKKNPTISWYGSGHLLKANPFTPKTRAQKLVEMKRECTT